MFHVSALCSLLRPKGRFSVAATAKESINEETAPALAGITTSWAVVLFCRRRHMTPPVTLL